MGEEVKVRFRHPSGDLGPYDFPISTPVQQLREKVVSEWPTDGPQSGEAPNATAEVRLILSGKILDHTKALSDYRKEIGELTSETIVTMHVHVVPLLPQQKQGTVPEKEAPKGCACIIC